MEGDNSQEKLNSQQIFPKLNADVLAPEITEVESLCMQCGQNGITKLLLTKIPFYKEVVVMSFFCEHCHCQNNELQPAATIQEKGVQYKLRVSSSKDLIRQVVKTEWASVIIPELNFEIPHRTQEGSITTVEGILERAYDGIKAKQEEVQATDPDASRKLQEFLNKLVEFKEAKEPFYFILRDFSGNSFIENTWAPKNDPDMEVMKFERTKEESEMLGILSTSVKEEDPVTHAQAVDDQSDDDVEEGLKNEVLEFPTNCPNCNAPCVTNMKLTHIPHFKDVVIMATLCESCGHKTNEVKSGGGIEPLGVKYSLRICDAKDLGRDLIKSDTCYVYIPELELEMGPTVLCGCYTTVEGLITSIKKQLVEDNPLVVGDSATPEIKEKMNLFLQKLDEVLEGKLMCTLVLDDPCGSSYLQSIHYPDADASLTVDKYKRTFEQDEELGLNDMKVENYEET